MQRRSIRSCGVSHACADANPSTHSHKQHLNRCPRADCKAGKGRTGTVIAALLVYNQICTSAADALSLFAQRRTYNARGVTIPSQMRYVEYFALQCTADAVALASASDAPVGGYWDAVSKGVGPWARGASTKSTPQPSIRLQSITLSHLPAPLLTSCCSPFAQIGALEWRVYSGCSDGGVDCRVDDRCRDVIARSPVTRMSAADGGGGAAAVPADTRVISGDFRVALYLRKRRLLDCSLHTAFLPLPREALEAVGGVAGTATLGALFSAAPSESLCSLAGERCGEGAPRFQADERVRTPFGVGTVSAAPFDANGFSFVRIRLPWAQAVLRADVVEVLRLPRTMRGTATFTKSEIDVAVKDKRHVLWPCDFKLSISYELDAPQLL